MNSSKKNRLNDLVKAKNAQELADCVKDVIIWQDKGMLSEGELYKLASHFVNKAGVVKISFIEKAGAAILREASLRFTEAETGRRAD